MGDAPNNAGERLVRFPVAVNLDSKLSMAARPSTVFSPTSISRRNPPMGDSSIICRAGSGVAIGPLARNADRLQLPAAGGSSP